MSDFWQDRIDRIKTRITALEDALEYLLANPAQSYTLDTGQSMQKYTAFDVEMLQKMLDGLINQLCIYQRRQGNETDIYTAAW